MPTRPQIQVHKVGVKNENWYDTQNRSSGCCVWSDIMFGKMYFCWNGFSSDPGVSNESLAFFLAFRGVDATHRFFGLFFL